MKKTLTAATVAAGLMWSGIALAQAPPMPGGPPAPAPAPTTTDAGAYDTGAYGTTDAGTYRTTGWDPSLLLFASGGLAAGSVALKGRLRKRA
jgi:opacity protein-like surface antigen